MTPPNILYLHSHDTGRYVQPYGYPVPTPNIQHLADQGVLFRQAFCAAPVCSGSRAALLTGQSTHATGMLGLAHRGYRLDVTPSVTSRTCCARRGYWSGLIGEQHVSGDPADLGYDHVVDLDSTKVRDVAPAACRLIAERALGAGPFFLSVGFFETHREYFEPSSVRDALYSRPPDNIVDTAMTRRDMASFKASARSLDQGRGRGAQRARRERPGRQHARDADHGPRPRLPRRQGHHVRPGYRGAADHAWSGRFRAGPGVRRAGEPAGPLPDHLRAWPGSTRPTGWKACRSLPLVRGEVDELHQEVFAEVTYHAAYEPQRAMRTSRGTSTSRRFDDEHPGRVLANLDDGLTKDVMLAAGGPTSTRRRKRSTTCGWIPAKAATGSTIPRSRPCSPICARASTSGWCAPATRSSTDRSRRRGHRVQHRRSGLAERADHAAHRLQPHQHAPPTRPGAERSRDQLRSTDVRHVPPWGAHLLGEQIHLDDQICVD